MRYIATGRLHPERAGIGFSPIEWQIPGQGAVVIHCEASQVTIIMNLDSIDGWATAFQQAKHFGSLVVSALGFAVGEACRLELIQVSEESGFPHVFGAAPVGRPQNGTLAVETPDAIFNRMTQQANQDHEFRVALRDYLRAIDDAVDCPYYCRRVVETVLTACGVRALPEGSSAMQALGLDPKHLETTITRFATPMREGGVTELRGTDIPTRWAMLTLARDTLIRYLDLVSPATTGTTTATIQ